MTDDTLKAQHVAWAKVAAIDVAAINQPDKLAEWIVRNRFRLADLELQSGSASDELRKVLHARWDAMPAAEAVNHV